MKVRDRMSIGVKTISMNTSLSEAMAIMNDNAVRRLPIIEKGQVVGIVTRSDLNKAGPSVATSLSKNEINYLLAKATIKDIVPKHQEVIVIQPDAYVETAAKLMRRHKISGLPVVEDGQLVGIITETDIFDALIDILGVRTHHARIDLYVADRPGELAAITKICADHGQNIINTVQYMENRQQRYKVILRLEGDDVSEIVDELKAQGFEIESVIIAEEESD